MLSPTKRKVTEAGAEGLYLTLFSEPGNSVTTGDPITFRSLTVGRVVETEFLADQKRIRHRIFVEQPYDADSARGLPRSRFRSALQGRSATRRQERARRGAR